ncbi:MAG: hypothetical protein GX279_02015 [Clostridiaceae bacterium]|jgi:hypothetical protein|nr:hypothetical protein [Clostridiaceae bacterium]
MELTRLMVLVKNCFHRNDVIGKRFISKKDGFGLNELLGIAAAIIIAAFVIIPSMRTFAKNMMDGLSAWWSNISSNIFPTS